VNALVTTLNEQSYLLDGPLPVVSIAADGSAALAASEPGARSVTAPHPTNKLSVSVAALRHWPIARLRQVVSAGDGGAVTNTGLDRVSEGAYRLNQLAVV
jgi:hypothetical protein